jgi:hypothetical protein
MGVGYSVSPLHRQRYLDRAALQQRPSVRGESPLLDTLADLGAKTIAEGPWRFQSPTVESILAWRQALAIKYTDRLGEELTWDERSTFETSEDVATSGDVMFHYVAAVLDLRGQAALRDLVHRDRPPSDEMGAAFTEADRRGLSGRFPQLLLGARIWLPFEGNLVIDEPDWDGKPHSYGSVFRFVDEVAAVRAGIADADPSVAGCTESDDPSEQILASAWQTSVTILRLATFATAKRLPLWTTG